MSRKEKDFVELRAVSWYNRASEASMELKVEKSRRKTLLLTVDRDGTPVVRTPLSASAEEIARFVKKHERWLARRIAERRSAPITVLGDGASVTLFGETYTLSTGRSGIRAGVLTLPAENRERAFVRLLKKLTAEKMGALTASLAAQYGFSYSAVRVSSARGRWGSCSAKGTISYTFRIALVPPSLAYYVAVHELCHTRRLDHSPAFWREVESILPDARSARKALRGYGYLMNEFL